MKIKYVNESFNQIFLPKSIISSVNIIPVRLILNIGSFKRDVKVFISDTLPEDMIELSSDLYECCKLPEDLEYEVRFDKRNIFIGPVIAFLYVSFKKSLTEEVLTKLEKYFIYYQEIMGLIYVCSTEGINLNDKTIQGLYFNPESSKWIEGTFPYPGAMFRRADLPKDIYNDLISSLGSNIFNTYFFNKWELWECLREYDEIVAHLPYTSRLFSLNDLDNMLSKYDSVYLKRISGYKAKGILKVKKVDDKYNFIPRLQENTILDAQGAKNYIQDLIKESPYIIQQSISVKKLDGRSFDFRVILQKDKYEKWTCSGIIARFGAVDSIATNFLLEGYALPGSEALMKVFGINQKEAFLKEQEIIQICINACKKLDESIGNYADLGIDVIVDENQKVWILEINKLHDHKYPLYAINDTQMYNTVITKPFEYAKALCGFRE